LTKEMETNAMGKPRKQHPHLLVLRGLRRGDGEMARLGIHEEIERATGAILVYLRDQADAASLESTPGPTQAARVSV